LFIIDNHRLLVFEFWAQAWDGLDASPVSPFAGVWDGLYMMVARNNRTEVCIHSHHVLRDWAQPYIACSVYVPTALKRTQLTMADDADRSSSKPRLVDGHGDVDQEGRAFWDLQAIQQRQAYQQVSLRVRTSVDGRPKW
jgi:hypothetical protein